MAHLYPQALLLLALLIDISECGDSSTQPVLASQGEDVVLPCFDSYVVDLKSCNRVKLIKYTSDSRRMEVILARPKTPKFQDAERIKWEADGNGQMSLFLRKSQKSDEGLYKCEIWQGWDCIFAKNISLRVKDCKVLRAVKAVPSTPVNLNCPVDITSGKQEPQNISWAMLKGVDPVPINSERVDINGTSLAIQSVDYSDSGWYRCISVLGQSQHCFDINLRVEVEHVVVTTVSALTTSEMIILENKEEGSSGAFIVLVTSVVIGIAITAALIGLFIYCRCKAQRVRRQTRRHPAGTLMESHAAYEIVTLATSEDGTKQRVNSLYQHFPDESLCTFQYE